MRRGGTLPDGLEPSGVKVSFSSGMGSSGDDFKLV